MPAMTLEQILVDPDFQKLSQSEQQAIINSMSKPVGATAALKGAEAISELPKFQRDIQIGYGPGVTLPSPERMLEFLPGITGSAGALIGSLAPTAPVSAPTLASIFAAGGEAWRQIIRRAMGQPQATGMVQSTMGLDPNSTEAAIAGVLGEGGTSLALEVPARGTGAVASGIPRQAQKQAAKALGFTKSTAEEAATHTPYLLEGVPAGATLSSKPTSVFKPFRSNTPEALLPRIQKIVDEAALKKEALLASPVGDIPIPPSTVRSKIASEVEHLAPDAAVVGPQTQPFSGAVPAASSREKALSIFDELQAAAAESQGKIKVASTGAQQNPVTGVQSTGIRYFPDPEHLNARTADEIRQKAMMAYKAAKSPLDASAGLGDRRVGMELTKQLDAVPALAPVNAAQHHGLGALTELEKVVQQNKVAGSGGVAPRAMAAAAAGSPLYGGALEAGSSALRSLGVSGQMAALLKSLSSVTNPMREPSTNYAALQSLIRLIEDLRVQQSQPAQPSPGE